MLLDDRAEPRPSAGPLLVSHILCPYVQRAAIALSEKGVPFERRDVDLSDKPAWFREISPLGKVPLLLVPTDGGTAVLFESAVILEYLEETMPHPLHPVDPLARARHRGWIEFASAVLSEIARFYTAPDREALVTSGERLSAMFARLEQSLGAGPYFEGERFCLVDAAFAPVFRYFDAFEPAGHGRPLAGRPKVAEWRAALAARPSVRAAVAPDYPARLEEFLARRPGVLASSFRQAAAAV